MRRWVHAACYASSAKVIGFYLARSAPPLTVDPDYVLSVPTMRPAVECMTNETKIETLISPEMLMQISASERGMPATCSSRVGCPFFQILCGRFPHPSYYPSTTNSKCAGTCMVNHEANFPSQPPRSEGIWILCRRLAVFNVHWKLLRDREGR